MRAACGVLGPTRAGEHLQPTHRLRIGFGQKLSVRHVSNPLDSTGSTFADLRSALKVRSKGRLHSIDRLAGDVIGILDHLGIDKAIVVGHDWGGYVVSETAVRYPDRVAGVVSLNSPHVKSAPADPIAMLRARFGERMYIVQFQDSREPDRILAENVDKVFDALLRGPLPGEETGGAGRGADQDFVGLVQAYDPASRHPGADHVGGGAAGLRRGLQTERLHRRDQLVSQHHPQLGKRSRSFPDRACSGPHDHGRTGSNAAPSVWHGRSRPQSDQASRAQLRLLDSGRKARRGERCDHRLAEARARTINSFGDSVGLILVNRSFSASVLTALRRPNPPQPSRRDRPRAAARTGRDPSRTARAAVADA